MMVLFDTALSIYAIAGVVVVAALANKGEARLLLAACAGVIGLIGVVALGYGVWRFGLYTRFGGLLLVTAVAVVVILRFRMRPVAANREHRPKVRR